MARWPKPALDPEWSGHDEAARRQDERLLAGVAASPDVDVTPEVVVGTAWKELASRSADLDLLVVGASACGPCAGCSSAARRRSSRVTPRVRCWWRRRATRPASPGPRRACERRTGHRDTPARRAKLGTRAHASIAAPARKPGRPAGRGGHGRRSLTSSRTGGRQLARAEELDGKRLLPAGAVHAAELLAAFGTCFLVTGWIASSSRPASGTSTLRAKLTTALLLAGKRGQWRVSYLDVPRSERLRHAHGRGRSDPRKEFLVGVVAG